jgi:hypothetical protein
MGAMSAMDLNGFWPTEPTLKASKTQGKGLPYTIGEYDERSGGFPVRLVAKGRTVTRIRIPKEYRNALRFLNFKISCYVASLQESFPIFWDVRTKNGADLSAVRDSMRRNLIFHSLVRDAFFRDMESAYYGSVSGRESKIPVNFSTLVRSPRMDKWLVQEYYYLDHNPDVVAEQKPIRSCEDPLVSGKWS